jgi:hypothetical protein
MSKGTSGRYRAWKNPGGPVWWIEYLAWKLLRVCWIGHPLGRATEDCRLFWWAERDLLDFKRHPERFEEVGLTAPPPTCLVASATATSTSFTIKCLCDRHEDALAGNVRST